MTHTHTYNIHASPLHSAWSNTQSWDTRTYPHFQKRRLSASLCSCVHTRTFFTKWGHWIIREMKKKSESLHRQSFQLYLFLWLSGCCLLKVMGSAHHSLLWDLVMRSQFAIWFPSTQDPMLDLITVLKNRCVSIPPWSDSRLDQAKQPTLQW